MRRLPLWVLALLLCCVAAGAAAQPSSARLILTVLDPDGERVPNAAVSLLARNGTSLPTPRTYLGPAGRVIADELPPGVYRIRVDAAGFVSAFLPALRLSGEVRHTVRLALSRVSETVVVQADPGAAIDPRGFSTVLTREQIDALPDDPADMAALLRDLAPPGAVIRVDGFPGGLMPPKSQILSIRLPRLDAYAAQEHGGLSALSFIEIVTTPGGGRLQASADLAWRLQALGARHPLTASSPADGARTFAVALDGPIIAGRASFAFAARRGVLDTPDAVRAVGPDGATLSDDPVRRQEWLTLSGRVVASLGGGHTARLNLSSEQRRAENAGVGGLNLRERAYRLSTADWTVRGVSSGPIGRRATVESRVELRWTGQRAVSGLEAPTIKVLDAFYAGGAQVAGGERRFDTLAAVDVEYGRGVHAIRTGVLVERGRSRAARHLNYLGTFTFTSLDAYRAGRPATYTRRVGRPATDLTNLQLALYAQDDLRLSRSVLIGYGVRYERQSLPGGAGRLLPRGSLAWSPAARGATTVRAGAGLFSEWVDGEVFHQSRLLDGTHQFDVLIHEPAYPAPDESGAFVRRERYGLAPDLILPLVAASGVGVEQQLGTALRVHAGYSRRTARHLLRGVHADAAADGVRQDPSAGRLLQATSDAGLRMQTISVQASSIGVGRRFSAIAAYVYTDARSNTAGPFAIPPSGRLEEEWGPTAPAHTLTATATVRAFGPISMTLTPRWRSGVPYTVTSGTDANGDGLFTDRPPGTPRQSGRTPSHVDLGARLSMATGIGRRPDDPGTLPRAAPGAAAPRYRVEVFVAVHNVTNRPAYTAIGSVVESPMYGEPLAARDPRRIDAGVRLAF